jgi:sec-independent protein translocase protein TatC
MRGHAHTTTRQQPTMMIHHIREIQLRLLSVVAVLIVGMVVGYFFYEPLFEFIKAPLRGPLHYMSPAGSFTFIIQICLMAGIALSLPVAVYNGIMFIQPALSQRLSRRRVYTTTLTSLALVVAGAAFGFLLIIPLALKFFSGFQISGLEAIISADEYLRFVVSIIITFVLIFQLPLLMSLADHIKPIPPKKMLKFEKYIILGSIFIAVVVPFANDLTVQTLIASPIIILYNVSIVVVLIQHAFRAKKERKLAKQESKIKKAEQQPVRTVHIPEAKKPQPIATVPVAVVAPVPAPMRRTVDGMRPMRRTMPVAASQLRTAQPKAIGKSSHPAFQPMRRAERRLITDMRASIPASRSRLTPPQRPTAFIPRQIVD